MPAREKNGRFLPGEKSRNRKEAEGERTQAEIVALIRMKVEAKLRKEAKASLGDYIRLVQLQKELEENDPREIKVTWVESKTKADPA